MGCTYLNENGQTKPMVMGCYGIGVTRTFASIVEQHHDDSGIIFPLSVAPYHVAVVPISYEDETQTALADNIYNELLKQRVEVIEDDRKLKPGFKFKDWELIGIPYMIIVGRRAAEGIVEFKDRYKGTKEEITYEEAIQRIKIAVSEIK